MKYWKKLKPSDKNKEGTFTFSLGTWKINIGGNI